MDRIVALSAVLVGLLSLLGTVLVSTHNGIETQRLAQEIVQLRLTVGLQTQRPAADASQPVGDVAALEQRVAALEGSRAPSQAEEPSAAASSTEPTQPVDVLDAPATEPSEPGDLHAPEPLLPIRPRAASSAPPPVATTGRADNCIPVGTRFMATKGDSFAICNVAAVVKVTAVSESIATIGGIGTLPAGGLAKIASNTCTLNVLSADATGYAEFKVTCP